MVALRVVAFFGLAVSLSQAALWNTKTAAAAPAKYETEEDVLVLTDENLASALKVRSGEKV